MEQLFNKLYQLTKSVEYSLNPILVKYNIRKSYLIQKDYNITNNIYNKYLELLKTNFEDVKFIRINQGILFTYTDLSFNKNNYNEYELGEFLSYPFPGDLINKRNYRISINLVNNCENINQEIISFIAEKKTNIELEKLFFNINQFISNNFNINYFIIINIDKLYTLKYLVENLDKVNKSFLKKKYIYNLFFNYKYELINNFDEIINNHFILKNEILYIQTQYNLS